MLECSLKFDQRLFITISFAKTIAMKFTKHCLVYFFQINALKASNFPARAVALVTTVGAHCSAFSPPADATGTERDHERVPRARSRRRPWQRCGNYANSSRPAWKPAYAPHGTRTAVFSYAEPAAAHSSPPTARQCKTRDRVSRRNNNR